MQAVLLGITRTCQKQNVIMRQSKLPATVAGDMSNKNGRTRQSLNQTIKFRPELNAGARNKSITFMFWYDLVIARASAVTKR